MLGKFTQFLKCTQLVPSFCNLFLPDSKNVSVGVPVVAQWVTNPTRHPEVAGSIPGLAQWGKDPA